MHTVIKNEYPNELRTVDKKPISKYSLGIKQRLGMAQGIIQDPKLLILPLTFFKGLVFNEATVVIYNTLTKKLKNRRYKK